MALTATELRHLEIPGIAEFRDGPGGLVFLNVESPLASARIFLQGAHVTHFQPSGEQSVLFMSQASQYTPGKAIRGGVPVIFPWFGPRSGYPDAPAHGFARLQPWKVESLTQTPSGEVTTVFRLDANEETLSQWPHAFVLRHIITVGKTLDMTLSVENLSEAPFAFDEALHTYLAVEDVRDVSVTGLANTDFYDKVRGFARETEGESPIRITGETDRIYVNTVATCEVEDPGAGRRLRVEKDGSNATVVWNPWIAKAAALADFGDDEWPKMICIETANVVDSTVTLEAGGRHEMHVVVGVER